MGRTKFSSLIKAGQLISAAVIGGVLQKLDSSPEILSIVAVVFIYLFVTSFQVGVGPIPSFLTAELFDDSHR